KFEPAGLTDDPDIRMSQSIMDYIFRRLALDHMSFDERAELGIYTAAERARYVETGSYTEPEAASGDVEVSPVEDGTDTTPDRPTATAAPTEPAEAPSEPAVAKEAPATAHTSAELMESMTGGTVDAPLCFTCGTKMRP